MTNVGVETRNAAHTIILRHNTRRLLPKPMFLQSLLIIRSRGKNLPGRKNSHGQLAEITCDTDVTKRVLPRDSLIAV